MDRRFPRPSALLTDGFLFDTLNMKLDARDEILFESYFLSLRVLEVMPKADPPRADNPALLCHCERWRGSPGLWIATEYLAMTKRQKMEGFRLVLFRICAEPE
ncbi:MAG: hypothetical protein Q7R62_01000 [bacterium]|nr:hypothetical protein [bacterium]